MHLTTSAADFSKETLVVKEEETYDAGVFEKAEAEVVKLFSPLRAMCRDVTTGRAKEGVRNPFG